MAQGIPRTINVLEVNANLEYAGGQRNMVTFAKYLRKDIFSVSVVAYQGSGYLGRLLELYDIPYMVARGDVEKILRFIEEKQIDIIHIHRSGGHVSIETSIIRGAKKINPNIIIIEKNVFGKFDPTLDSIIDCSLFQSMMHVNERYLPKSRKSFDFFKQKVFYNMVDRKEFDAYKVDEKRIDSYKKSIGIAPTDFVIGKIARPALEKWSDLIIDMVPYLVKKVPNVKIVIMGCPSSREKRIKRSRYKDFFIFLSGTPNQNEVHDFYQAIDVLAHSSKIGECNGNTINEAMYWRKPVIVNSTPRKDNGQLEQVVHMKNGIVANTPITFAKGLIYLAENKEVRDTMGEAGFKQVETVNDPGTMTKRLEKLFLEKIQEKRVFENFTISSEYKSVVYAPGQEEIRQYIQEYKQRIKWEFGELTVYERFLLSLSAPRKLYYKIKDFLEHKWQSYAKR